MSIDSEKLLPNKSQRQWIAAQAYVLEKDGTIEEMRKTAAITGDTFREPNLQAIAAKKAYDAIKPKLTRNGMDRSGEDLFDNLLHEKALLIDKFDKDLKLDDSVKETPNNPAVYQLKHQADQVHEAEDMESLNEKKIRRDIEAIMSQYGAN